jgi:DNA repair ATPase RecN
MGFSIDDLFNSTIPQLKSALDQMDQGLVAIDTALTQLENGEITINQALAELDAQSSVANFQMNSAMSEIVANQATLTATVAQLDNAKKEIDASADELKTQKQKAMDAARRFQPAFCRRAAELVLETDRQMKTSFDDQDRLLELLILQLAQEARRG